MKIAASEHNISNEHAETQQFRILLQAFGYPARIYDMGQPALEAVLTALCDAQSPVSLEGCAIRAELLLKLRLVPLVSRDNAQFIACDVASLHWNNLPIGSREAPEDGATLIVDVAQLSTQTGRVKFKAKGAGVKEIAFFWLDELTAARLTQRPKYDYPCGIDLILVCGSKLMTLPRHLHWEQC